MSKGSEKVAGLEEARVMRDHFLGWQCRLRQLSAREAEGRPTLGMAPQVYVDETALGRIVVVLVQRQPRESTTQFSYLVRQTQDPVERHEKGLKILQAEHYQLPEEFSDKLTALFGPGSEVAGRLLEAGHCELDFGQYSQSYQLPCAVEGLQTTDPAYQATYWHNQLFNPAIPPGAQVLAFSPNWHRASASPSPY